LSRNNLDFAVLDSDQGLARLGIKPTT